MICEKHFSCLLPPPAAWLKHCQGGVSSGVPQSAHEGSCLIVCARGQRLGGIGSRLGHEWLGFVADDLQAIANIGSHQAIAVCNFAQNRD